MLSGSNQAQMHHTYLVPLKTNVSIRNVENMYKLTAMENISVLQNETMAHKC